MVEGGEHLCLALEALEPLGVGGHLRRQNLERHLALELGVPGEVDLPHPALAELVEDPVVGEGLADHGASDPIVTLSEGRPGHDRPG